MRIATYSNTRTAIAAETGLNAALNVSFTSGSIMGLMVVSVGLGSLSALLMAFNDNAIDGVAALTGTIHLLHVYSVSHFNISF
jgi:K(+)-stimulated pyrophosphate-energized sodium pump